MNVLITGANRGIGLGFVKHHLEHGHDVWACYRTTADSLSALGCEKLHLLQWDVGLDDDPEGELPASIDLLINNAGIYGPGKDGQSLHKVTSEAMLNVFNIDCIGPLRVVQKLADRVINAKGVIANISSKMGSSDDNSSGGTYAYRAAKAGLVIVSRSMAMDLAPYGVHVITLHPGWVATDMTGNNGLIDIDTSVTGMSSVINRARNFHQGQFVAFDGKIVPY